MNKVGLIICMLCSINSYAQKVIVEDGLKLWKKLLGEEVYKVPEGGLSQLKSEAERKADLEIAERMATESRFILPKEKGIFLKSGIKETSFKDPTKAIEAWDKIIITKIPYNKSSRPLITTLDSKIGTIEINNERIRIKQLQKDLNSLGAKIEENGIMNAETKRAIEKYLKVNTLKKTNAEIERESYYELYRNGDSYSELKKRTAKTERKYHYQINDEKGNVIDSRNDIAEVDLQKTIDKLSSEMECGIGDVCIGESVNLSFTCRDKAGNKILFDLASNGNIDVNIKGKGGESLKISAGKEGASATIGNQNHSQTIDTQ